MLRAINCREPAVTKKKTTIRSNPLTARKAPDLSYIESLIDLSIHDIFYLEMTEPLLYKNCNETWNWEYILLPQKLLVHQIIRLLNASKVVFLEFLQEGIEFVFVAWRYLKPN